MSIYHSSRIFASHFHINFRLRFVKMKESTFLFNFLQMRGNLFNQQAIVLLEKADEQKRVTEHQTSGVWKLWWMSSVVYLPTVYWCIHRLGHVSFRFVAFVYFIRYH